jgi:hypothetical protein
MRIFRLPGYPGRTMGNDPLDDLRELVIDDPSLRNRLLSAPDRTSFINGVVEMAGELGIDLSADVVVASLGAAQAQSWERWV